MQALPAANLMRYATDLKLAIVPSHPYSADDLAEILCRVGKAI
jgi:hypothetical protein